MSKKILIIGGCGFLGGSIARSLSDNNYSVSVLDKFNSKIHQNTNIENDVIIGNINDKDILIRALYNVDTVFYFVSSSFPGMNHKSLQFEIENTLQSLDFTLNVMREAGVNKIFFPSSGGTVYGELTKDILNEEHILLPVSAYGTGKYLCEEILKYYSRVHNFNTVILRISNVYGCPFYRKVQQGAVDIFIQKALDDEEIHLWGDPSLIIRDHLFIDDLCSAVISLLDIPINGTEIFNIATGKGESLQNIIENIEINIKKPLKKIFKPNHYTGVNRNVLDISKIKKITGWEPKYFIEDGIKITIEKKINFKTQIINKEKI